MLAERCKHSFFLKKKSDQVDRVSSWLKGLKDKHKIQAKLIHCDNAGENKKLGDKCDADGLGIIFEYTATGTCGKSFSNFDGKSQSNDELCRVHKREKKTAMISMYT